MEKSYQITYNNFESESIFVNNDLNDNNKYEKLLKKLLYVLIILFISITLLSIGLISLQWTNNLSISSFSSSKQVDPLSVTVSNEYGEISMSNYPYNYLSNSILTEVYKSNSIIINSIDKTCQYDYSIVGVTDDTFTMSGLTDELIIFEPTATGQFTFTINEICNNQNKRTLLTNLYSKYIRRELSKLTDDDRTNFLNAMYTLWTVSTIEGQKLYGENYKSAQYFAIVHNDATGSPICDEFHSGSGFLNNHILLNSYFEQSLQLVNPKTALHYWEYVKDFDSDSFQQHQINQLDGGRWTEIMSSKYFGSNDPLTGEIIDSQWASYTLPTLTNDELINQGVDIESTFFPEEQTSWFAVYSQPHVVSPYGYLRAAQNYNPNNKLTRYNNVNGIADFTAVSSDISSTLSGIDCDDYNSFLTDITDQSFEYFLTNYETYIHGNVHPTIGGSGGDITNTIDQYLINTYDFSNDDIVFISSKGHFFKKYITMLLNSQVDYSQDASFPLLCDNLPFVNGQLITDDLPNTSNGPHCYCNPKMISSSTGISKFLSLLHLESSSSLYTKIKSLSLDQQTDVLNKFCGRFQYDGELSGASAIDPIFWVIHGPVEKLYHKIVFDNLLTDSTYVDEKEYCSGHKADSVKVWSQGFYLEDASVNVHELTNTQLAAIFNPSSIEYGRYINYVYDHSNWDSICGIE